MAAASPSVAGKRVLFLLTGGEHQVLHLAPLAAELDTRGADVELVALDKGAARMAREFFERVGRPGIRVRVPQAGLTERLTQRRGEQRPPRKLLRLMSDLPNLRGHDAVIVAERTSAFLRRLRLVDGIFIHIPHGTGDREGGYDPRARVYDYHVFSGPTDVERYLARGLGRPDNLFVSGSIKLAGIEMAYPDPPRDFDNGRATVLYNPHFEEGLSSFDPIGLALLEAFAKDRDRNYVFAPHMRLANRLSASTRARLKAMAGPNLVVDLGSEKSCDMTYTRTCDIYLGDVSSQVYEFLAEPRPCVFANPYRFDWKNDRAFRFWKLGEVAETPGAILAAIARAPSRHSEFIDLQREYAGGLLGCDWRNAPRIAADRIAALLA